MSDDPIPCSFCPRCGRLLFSAADHAPSLCAQRLADDARLPTAADLAAQREHDLRGADED